LHRHIIGRKGQNLQRVKDTYGVEIIVPDEKDESPDILIVFEGKEGEEIPSDRKKKETYIKDVLEKAKTELVKAGQDAVGIKMYLLLLLTVLMIKIFFFSLILLHKLSLFRYVFIDILLGQKVIHLTTLPEEMMRPFLLSLDLLELVQQNVLQMLKVKSLSTCRFLMTLS
jgi:hypothetical protein